MKKKYILLSLFVMLLLTGSFMKLYSQSLNKNYVKTRKYTNESATTFLDVINYYDGLGRPIQSVQSNITPSKHDLVTYQEYDNLGRESNQWLPTVIQNNNGIFVELQQVNSDGTFIYQDSNPYNKTVYEASSLNRILEMFGPGKKWHDNNKANRYEYATNKGVPNTSSYKIELNKNDILSGVITACEQIILKPGFVFSATDEKSMVLNIDPSICNQSKALNTRSTNSKINSLNPAFLYCTNYQVSNERLIKKGNYSANSLYVTLVADEDDNVSLEFKDKLGQVLLFRQINGSEKYDTYYVYDDFGNLCYVLPPLAVDKLTNDISDNAEVMRHYAYIYKYDYRNRCIKKRLPGCDWILYVYDKADQIIFTQDGEQRVKKPTADWTYNIYDVSGRIILSGIHKTNESHHDLIERCKNIVVEEKSHASSSWGYTWSSFPSGYLDKDSPLTANYYDKYNEMINCYGDEKFKENLKYIKEPNYGERYINTYLEDATPKGLLTGTKIRCISADGKINNELVTTLYYDYQGRIIQKKSTNHMGGYEKEYIAYDFLGNPIRKKHIHSINNSTSIIELYTYTYDHAGRLIQTTHKVNNLPEIILFNNSYDELGRLHKTNIGLNK